VSRIFISYSRKDEQFARKLAASLSEIGADVWIDVENIPAGMKWHHAIADGLDICDVMLLIVSPDSMKSDNVDDEWSAFHGDGKPIIPVIWRDATVHFQLRRVQYVKFENRSFPGAFEELITELGRYVDLTDHVSTHESVSSSSIPFDEEITDIPAKPADIKRYNSLLSSCYLLDLYDVNHVRELNIEDRWQKNLHDIDWLTVPIGVDEKGTVRNLIFSPFQDGVHAYIAGKVGSGKSEFIISLITNLAINYDPTRFSFVFLDNVFAYHDGVRDFPQSVKFVDHTQAIVSELQAIVEETQRRFEILVKYGVKHIVEYHHNNYPQKYGFMPHLFVVIDHLDVLLRDAPHAIESIIELSRVGRVMGIHLILASETLPEHSAMERLLDNIKLCVALRTDADVSQHLIGSDVAGQISASLPGRAYLRIGNEALEPVAIAYSGRNLGWKWHFHDEPLPSGGYVDKEIQDTPLPISYHCKWLPGFVSLEDLLLNGTEDTVEKTRFPLHWQSHEDEKDALNLQIGLLETSLNIYHLNLYEDGNTLIYGANGTGKTTFIQTILLNLALKFSPDDIDFHIIAPRDEKLHRIMGKLPHVDSVLEPGEPDSVLTLFNKINSIIRERWSLIMESDNFDYVQYNMSHDTRIKPIVLAVDTLSDLLNSIPDLITVLVDILRKGRITGVYIVATDLKGDSWEKLSPLFIRMLMLRMDSKLDYVFVFGRELQHSDCTGRAYLFQNREIVKTQLAAPTGEYKFASSGGDTSLAKIVIELRNTRLNQ